MVYYFFGTQRIWERAGPGRVCLSVGRAGQKLLSADVEYIIPTNHACRIVTHARYINRACLRKLIL